LSSRQYRLSFCRKESPAIDATFEQSWSQTLSGGAYALDFVNTLDWRGREQPVETLHQYADFLRFALASGVIDLRQAKSLLAWAVRHPKRSAKALERAKTTRETVALLIKASSKGEALPRAALARLEEDARDAWKARSLVPQGLVARWQWAEGDPDPDLPRWAAALDAARLLTGEEHGPIRECEGADCGWFFLDESRNRRRRWCSMEACGNRAKARRFYRRKRAASAPSA
jgi:predicted RNA-binding Zn ribbon-like protein